MTEPRDQKDETGADNDFWLEEDDELIELTERVSGPAETLEENLLELSHGEEVLDLSDLAPLSEEEDDVVELIEAVDEDGEMLRFEGETLELGEAGQLLGDDLMKDQVVDLTQEALDLTAALEPKGIEREVGALPLDEGADLNLDFSFDEVSRSSELEDDTLELSTLLEEMVPDSNEVEVASTGGTVQGIADDEEIDLVDIDLLLAEEEDDGFPLEPMDDDSFMGALDSGDLILDEEAEPLMDFGASSQEEGLLEELGDETLVLTDTASDDDELLELGEPLTESGEEGLLDGLLDQTLTLSEAELEPAESVGDFSKNEETGLLDDLSGETLVLPTDNLDAPDAQMVAPEEGLLADLSDDALLFSEEIGDEEVVLEMAAPLEDGIDGLLDEALLLSEEELVATEPVTDDGLLDLGPDSELETIFSAPEETEPVEVLDLSELVEASTNDTSRQRTAPGYPKGTFDLSGIVDIPDSHEMIEGRVGDQELDMAVASGDFSGVSDAQLERVVERVVTTLFKDRIEELIVDAIGKNLSEDIEKMKELIQENFS